MVRENKDRVPNNWGSHWNNPAPAAPPMAFFGFDFS